MDEIGGTDRDRHLPTVTQRSRWDWNTHSEATVGVEIFIQLLAPLEAQKREQLDSWGSVPVPPARACSQHLIGA